MGQLSHHLLPFSYLFLFNSFCNTLFDGDHQRRRLVVKLFRRVPLQMDEWQEVRALQLAEPHSIPRQPLDRNPGADDERK